MPDIPPSLPSTKIQYILAPDAPTSHALCPDTTKKITYTHFHTRTVPSLCPAKNIPGPESTHLTSFLCLSVPRLLNEGSSKNRMALSLQAETRTGCCLALREPHMPKTPTLCSTWCVYAKSRFGAVQVHTLIVPSREQLRRCCSQTRRPMTGCWWAWQVWTHCAELRSQTRTVPSMEAENRRVPTTSSWRMAPPWPCMAPTCSNMLVWGLNFQARIPQSSPPLKTIPCSVYATIE
mmetsp:Transcript_7188/g.21577  ORF Transcript_7188/g.21577 Transcript_7188/m.21577 type:complete len:235 (-) Transcript_7188:172-876(-)